MQNNEMVHQLMPWNIKQVNRLDFPVDVDWDNFSNIIKKLIKHFPK